MKIRVTKKDIELGEPGSGTTCPIARAVRRVYQGRDVFAGFTYVKVKSISGVTILPEKVMDFISDFDSMRPVEPFTFDLPLPNPRLKTICRHH